MVTTSRLLNDRAQFGRPKGSVVGSERMTVKSRPDRRWFSVDAVARLPGGTIVVRGDLRFVEIYRAIAPVVGGTGAFSGARGTMTWTISQAGIQTIYRLNRP